MKPGTNRVRARHTQGALFLEVREGAKTAQSCNITEKNSPGYIVMYVSPSKPLTFTSTPFSVE